MTNFSFLKKIDNNLYEVITEAEKLYTSEFFEQCIGQTRRFGELLCKNILADKRRYDGSFDEMLATLKDNAHSIPEKEFIDDLYFLKKQGNISVHSSKVKRDGILAFECLQRAFEASINYAVLYKKGSKSILKKQYDVNLLMTGKPSLKEKYENVAEETKKPKTKPKKPVQQAYKMKSVSKKKKPLFWIFVCISSVISMIILLTMFLLNLMS